MENEKLMTEDQFKEHFKELGFELYKVEAVTEKLHAYEAMKDALEAQCNVFDRLHNIIKPKEGESIVEAVKIMKQDSI